MSRTAMPVIRILNGPVTPILTAIPIRMEVKPNQMLLQTTMATHLRRVSIRLLLCVWDDYSLPDLEKL